MNPPFTKIESGIKKYVNMDATKMLAGGTVGLWGHFIVQMSNLLKSGGIFGAVLPINLLRGTESTLVREILFNEFTPLFVLKPTINYGFSEWSEYRDILFIARKQPSAASDEVKFCLVKKDLTRLTHADIVVIASDLANKQTSRDDKLVDIDTCSISDLKSHFPNLMWFCGVSTFRNRDIIVKFVSRLPDRLSRMPKTAFLKTGFRTEGKMANVLFLTRSLDPARVQQAFLRFEHDRDVSVHASTAMGAVYKIEREVLQNSLRTPVAQRTMDFTGRHDYVAKQAYEQFKPVCSAANIKCPDASFWDATSNKLSSITTHLAVAHRINPFSPANHHVAFFSSESFAPSDQMHAVIEKDLDRAKALCAILNSIIFLAQFILLKEESTGRFINIREYDLLEMFLVPRDLAIELLAKAFVDFGETSFPALREQLDADFDQRFKEFWERERMGQGSLFSILASPIKPLDDRLKFDLAVCEALEISMTREGLCSLYAVIVQEMIVTKGLIKD